jgi:uncharacterized caspase-like protein
MQLRYVLAVVPLLLASAKAQAPLDIRVALVIGNAAYSQIPKLNNSGNDAKSIATALHSLGFSVVEVSDGSKAQITTALEKVHGELKDQHALGMLYYAGHGLQLDWHNYILPVDISIKSQNDVIDRAVDVNTVVDVFRSADTRMNVLVLDACRDNPFVDSVKSNKGLAQMDAPVGTLLAYATQPGNVAEDGDEASKNGPYAEFLISELRRPFATVEDVFKRVRFQVRNKTQGRQIPWESTSLEENLVFNDGAKYSLSAADLERLAKEAKVREQSLNQQASQAREREQQLAIEIEVERRQAQEKAHLAEQARLAEQDRIKEAERIASNERDLELQRIAAEAQKRERGLLAQEQQARERERVLLAMQAEEAARQKQLTLELEAAQATELRRQQVAAQQAKDIALRESLKALSQEKKTEEIFAQEKADWDRIKESREPGKLYAYLDRFPNGTISELAQARLEILDKPKIQAQPDQTGLVQPLQAKRFVLGDTYQFVIRDLLSKLETERPTFKVTATNEEWAEFNQGYKVTQAGAIIRTIAGATLDPYQQWIPAGEYQVGKKWHTRSILTTRTGQSQWVDLHGQVLAREKITVPAGTFDTYKMQMLQTAQDGSTLNITYWGQPDWGVAIKQIREIRSSRGAPSGQIYELVSRSRSN